MLKSNGPIKFFLCDGTIPFRRVIRVLRVIRFTAEWKVFATVSDRMFVCLFFTLL